MYVNQRHCRKEEKKSIDEQQIWYFREQNVADAKMYVCLCLKRLQSFLSCFSFFFIFLLLPALPELRKGIPSFREFRLLFHELFAVVCY